jgi:monovalent cation:H+ antiporter-2, CPA2 family
MHEVPLLINIAMALVVAFVGGLLARRIRLPAIFGYLLAGIVIGPFTPGYIGDVETVSQLAELGVIFLMFGVGLHFSFQDLWRVRDIAIPGALAQTLLATLLGIGLTRLLGWPIVAGVVTGLAISVASTVVLLRGLMDASLLNTTHGQAAVGWLVMEDLLTVLILVLMPAFAPTEGDMALSHLGLTLLKAAAFVALVGFVGRRLIPWLLDRIAHTRSRELFILAVLAIALGTALGAAELFGVSLALGAFVAGAVVSESPLSHQVGADVLPFREAFAVLFFVSVGMLVNPAFLWQNIGPVLALTALILIGKPLIVLLLGLFFSRSAFTMLVIAAGLSQIGEFSFILGQAGLSLNLIRPEHYSLILAGALLSIMLNPLMFRLINPMHAALQRLPWLWRRLDRHDTPPPPADPGLSNHLVIVGYGQVGQQIVQVARSLEIPHLVIESDVERVELLNAAGTETLFGDAANSEVLTHAGLDRARVLVVTVPDDVSSEMVIVTARTLAPQLSIMARASAEAGVQRLAEVGAQVVIHPQLEGGLEMVRHTLLHLGFPLREVFEYTDAVRHDHYNIAVNTDDEHRLLHALLDAADNIEIHWLRLNADSPLIDRSLSEVNLRARTGASVVALLRNGHLQANPKSSTLFEVGDRIGLVGDPEQITAAIGLVEAKEAEMKNSQAALVEPT